MKKTSINSIHSNFVGPTAGLAAVSTKNYQNLAIGFQVTVENVGDTF